MGTDDADGALTIDGHRFWCCSAIGCDSIASIVVQSGTDAPYAYCGLHWDELRRPFGHENALYVPDRPDCFHTDCQTRRRQRHDTPGWHLPSGVRDRIWTTSRGSPPPRPNCWR